MKSSLSRLLVVLLLILCSVLGCSPIETQEEIEKELIGTEVREEQVGAEPDIYAVVDGDDPRSDGAVSIRAARNLQCQERRVEHYRRNQITTRKLDGWYYPAFIAGSALFFGLCSASHAAEAGCVSHDEEEEGPMTADDHRTNSIIFGSMAAVSVGILVVDLFRTIDTTEMLGEEEELSSPQAVACGSEPMADVQVVHRWESDTTPVWTGRTDGSGRVEIPVSELGWIDDSPDGGLGMITVDDLPVTDVEELPPAWHEIREEEIAERVFDKARDSDEPQAWLDAFDELGRTERAEYAFRQFLLVTQARVESGEWEGMYGNIRRAERIAPSQELREEVQLLHHQRFLEKARQGVNNEADLSVSSILHAYERAIEYGPSAQENDSLRREALDYGLEALALSDEDRDDDGEFSGDVEATLSELETLEELATTDEDRDRITALRATLDAEIGAAQLARARQLRDDDEVQRDEVIAAYEDAFDNWSGDDEEFDAAQREYAQLVVAPLRRLLRAGRIRHLKNSYRALQQNDHVDDDIVRQLYRQMVFEEVGSRYASGNRSVAPDLERHATELAREDNAQDELLDAIFGGFARVVEREQDGLGPADVTPVREVIRDFRNDEQLNEFDGVEEVIDRHENGIRDTLRGSVALHQLDSLVDAKWLYPGDLTRRSQIQSMLDEPDSYVGQRVYLDLSVDRSIGDGRYLGALQGNSENIIVTGSGMRPGRRLTALVEVTDSMADNRAGGNARLPVVRVVWNP